MTGVLKAEFCQLEKEEKGSQGQGTRRGGPARGHTPRRGWAPGASGGVGSQAPRTLQGPNLPQRLWGPGQGSCSGSGPYAIVHGRGRGRQVRGLPLRSQTVRRAGRGEGRVRLGPIQAPPPGLPGSPFCQPKAPHTFWVEPPPLPPIKAQVSPRARVPTLSASGG